MEGWEKEKGGGSENTKIVKSKPLQGKIETKYKTRE